MLEPFSDAKSSGTETDFILAMSGRADDTARRLYEDSDLSRQNRLGRKDDSDSQAPSYKSTTEVLNIIERGTASFRRFDQNQDGFLSWSEVDRAILDPTLTDNHLEFVLLLKTVDNKLKLIMRDTTIAADEGMSRADLNYFQEIMRKGQTNPDNSIAEQLVIDEALRCHKNVQTALKDMTPELYKNSESPLSNIRPEAIKQGMVGDCYFLSSVSATARFAPESILKMIEDNKNGTYTVTFPGAPNNPITVAAPTRAEQAFFTKGSPEGFWPLVLEKAYGEFVQKNTHRDFILDADSVSLGGLPEKVLKLLSGFEVESYITEITPEAEVESLLLEATRDKRPIVAGTDKGPIVDNNGLVGQHAYSVLDFDPSTKTVTLRNPYGRQESVKNDSGVELKGHTFQMPLADFCRCFSTLSIVQPFDPARRRPAKQQLG